MVLYSLYILTVHWEIIQPTQLRNSKTTTTAIMPQHLEMFENHLIFGLIRTLKLYGCEFL